MYCVFWIALNPSNQKMRLWINLSPLVKQVIVFQFVEVTKSGITGAASALVELTGIEHNDNLRWSRSRHFSYILFVNVFLNGTFGRTALPHRCPLRSRAANPRPPVIEDMF